MTMPPVQTLRAYVELTKPRILLLVIFTGLPVMAMAAEGSRP
jgi:heme O synthase-like polyprenyltransferase